MGDDLQCKYKEIYDSSINKKEDFWKNIAEDIYYAVSGEPLFDGSSDPTWEAILPKKK